MEHTTEHADFIARRDVHLGREVPLDDATGQARELNDGPGDLARQQDACDEGEKGPGQRMQVKPPADGRELAKIDISAEVDVQCGDSLPGRVFDRSESGDPRAG